MSRLANADLSVPVYGDRGVERPPSTESRLWTCEEAG
jgi:hypothetical protein